MAQGFIQTLNSGQSLEDVGHDYFMDLLWRSFFQEVGEDEWGNIKSCKMHDLMHDLATSVAGTECSLMSLDVANGDESHENTRHVSFGEEFNYSWRISSALLKANKMRTFFQPFDYGKLSESNVGAIIRSFRCLRMLNLKGSTFEKLPPSIRKLKHLRHLDLSRNKNITQLSNCMTRLVNLQTLDLSECKNLTKWPKEIRNMVNLRHIYIGDCDRLGYIPRGLGQLTCLRTLTWFKVSGGDGQGGGLSELKGLNNLRGSLKIFSLENASTPDIIGAGYLEEKSYLESLLLGWGDDYEGGVDDEMVLESLRPHPNLKKLAVMRFKGAKFSNWLSFISNLVQIEIFGCWNCRNLPPMDNLPSLKSLDLSSLSALEYVTETALKTDTSSATTFFPSLEYLKISHCTNLKGWWRTRKEDEDEDEESTEATSTIEEEEILPCFPRLSKVVIHTCPKLTSFPPFPTLNEELTLWDTSGRLLRQTIRKRSKGEIITSSLHRPFSNLKSLWLTSVQYVESVLEQILQKTHCTCLQSLYISHCSELPKEVHALPSLHRLEISGCENLRALPNWIPHLHSLQELRIWNCPQLSALPQGMSQLTNLRLLVIGYCRSLGERCRKDKGADWAQISHVPDIRIIDRGW